MRYKADQKRKTHDRIVAGAARLFRAEGYEGSGVDEVMKSAGLTAGGFYAHFKNKDALLAEALERCWAESAAKLSQAAAGGPDGPADLALRWVDRYLSGIHRARPGAGCPLPTLAGEVPRQPKAVRAAFTRTTRAFLDVLARHMPGRTRAEREEQAIAVQAAIAGAMLLARAVDDEQFSDQILRTMRRVIREQLIGATRGGRRKPRVRTDIRATGGATNRKVKAAMSS